MPAGFWHTAADFWQSAPDALRAALDRGVEGGRSFWGTCPMRRLGALLLCLGLITPAFAASDEPPPAEEKSVPWYRWLWLGERSKPSTTKATAAAKENPKTPAKTVAAPVKQPPAPTLADEQRVFLERLKAIDKIRKIANELGDEELLKKTYDLEEQAEAVFMQRIARLSDRGDDRAVLERGRDDRPATADRSAPRRPNTRGDKR